MPVTWSRQEPGWYTSELGAICRELNGWVFYPAAGLAPYRVFRTASAAMGWAETGAGEGLGARTAGSWGTEVRRWAWKEKL